LAPVVRAVVEEGLMDLVVVVLVLYIIVPH
jgi:hypothetical protein